MVVTVFGLGFVGLTTALGFADKGIKTYGIEINQDRMKIIASGQLPFLEPGLGDALKRNLNQNFMVDFDIKKALQESDCVYYCVGTPCGEDGQADLTYLYKAINQTLEVCKDDKFRVLVTKSTIPPSTTKEKIVPFVEQTGRRVGLDIGVANNPEFLREGCCWEDFNKADRIVLGVSDEQSEKVLMRLYQDFEAPIFAVSLNTGEFIKYLSNTLLATLISFSNEMSVIADTIGGIEIAEAFKILHMDKRWAGCNMASYVYPGCGYGGYCLPKDTSALLALTKQMGYEPGILEQVITINHQMPKLIVDRITKEFGKQQKIGILGLSFKPNSDDVRDTPAVKIIQELQEAGYQNLVAYDPVAEEEFASYYPVQITYSQTLEEILSECDGFIIATAWQEFKGLNKKTDKKIIDCRYML